MIQVPVGSVRYTIQLVEGFARDGHGNECLGTCDPMRQTISISLEAPADRRLQVLWHELAHAWKHELDISDGATLGEEPLCNLIGLAMSAMGLRTIAALIASVQAGEICHDVLMIAGVDEPIPVIRPKARHSSCV